MKIGDTIETKKGLKIKITKIHSNIIVGTLINWKPCLKKGYHYNNLQTDVRIVHKSNIKKIN